MGNLTLEDVNNMYLDVLKEIGNIGAGNATTAIANMLGMKIDMNVPNVKLMEVSKLGTAVGAEDETIVGIFLEVMNDIEGSMMFLVDIPSARYLVNKLMMEDVPADKPFDEMELSALKEGTNEYNTVKEKIVAGYSKYYEGLEEEINKVGLTEEAYKKLTDAITHSYGARQYQQFKSQQEDWLDNIMSDNLGKIQDRLYSELGDKEGVP